MKQHSTYLSRVGMMVAAGLVLVQLLLGTQSTPPVHADEGIPTPTPTATPVRGICNEYQC